MSKNKSLEMASRLELWPVARLKPYANNARTHSAEQITKIAASIVEFGFTNPVLVDSDSGIIAGHGRVMAAQQLGMSQVPVIELTHLTDAQRRAYILADNRLALDAGWDNDLLSTELAALAEDDYELSLTGFTEDEIERFLEGEPQDAPGNGEQSGPEAGIKMSFGAYRFEISIDDNDRLSAAYEQYVASYGSSFGFVNWLMAEVRA